MATDHEGNEIPADEPDDVVIKVWEVTPHPGDRQYDAYWERSWQNMLTYVGEHLDVLLERRELSELEEEPLVLKIGLRTVSKDEYLGAMIDN